MQEQKPGTAQMGHTPPAPALAPAPTPVSAPSALPATVNLDARFPPPRGAAAVGAGAPGTNPLPVTAGAPAGAMMPVHAAAPMAAPYYRYYAPPATTNTAQQPQVPQLTYMEGQLTTQAMLVEQQRRIKQLEAELVATRAEVARLHAQARARPGGADAPPTEEKKPSSRYWTPDEHKRFLEGLELFGPRDIKAISRHVGTRTPTQVRTHSQKYWQRVERERKKAAEAAGTATGAGTGATSDPKAKSPNPNATIAPKVVPPANSAPAPAPGTTDTTASTSPRRRSTRPRTRTAAAQAAIAAERPNGSTNTNSSLSPEQPPPPSLSDDHATSRKRAHSARDDDDHQRRVKHRPEPDEPPPNPPVPGAGGLLRVPSTSALPASEGDPAASAGAGGALPSSELPPPMLTSVPSAGTLAGLLPLVASSSTMGLTSVPSLSTLPHVPSLGALSSLPRVSSATGLPSLPRVASSLTAAWKGAEVQADRLPPRPAPPPPPPPPNMQRSDSAANMAMPNVQTGAKPTMPRTNSILSLLSGLPTAAMNEELDDATSMALHESKWSTESS